MRKLFFTTLLLVLCSASTFAEYQMYLMGDSSFCRPADGYSINISDKNVTVSGNGEEASFSRIDVSGIKFLKPLVINFSDLSSLKDIPDGMTVDVINNDVTVTFANDFDVNHYDVVVTGESNNGSLTIMQSSKLKITLDNLSLSAEGKPAINIVNSKNINIELIGKNEISCSANNSELNAALYSEASLIFKAESESNLIIKSNTHGIRSKEGVSLDDANVQISIDAGNDGVRANDYFVLNSGSLTINALGDGIDANKSYITINGGYLDFKNSTTSVDAKALKCDGDITVNGGSVTLNMNGIDNKGFSTGKYEVNKATADSAFGNVVVNNGNIEIYLNAVMEEDDSTSCSAMKSDGDILIYGGSIYIESGLKNHRTKGFNADGNVKIYDGQMTIDLQGDACRNIACRNSFIEGGKIELATSGGLFKEGDPINESSASCIKADNSILISGTPEITLHAMSTKGKGMNADSSIIIKGGIINCNLFGNGAKGLNCGYEFGGKIEIDGAETILNISIGGGLYEFGDDDSKTAAIKSDDSVDIKNGTVTIIANNVNKLQVFESIRGISANGDVTISGGHTEITINDAIGKTYAIKSDGSVKLKKGCLEYSCPETEVEEDKIIVPAPEYLE